MTNNYVHLLYVWISKDMLVNEHVRLSNFTFRYKFKKAKEQYFYSCSSFNIQSKVFNIVHNSYSKIRVKPPLASGWEESSTSVDNGTS